MFTRVGPFPTSLHLFLSKYHFSLIALSISHLFSISLFTILIHPSLGLPLGLFSFSSSIIFLGILSSPILQTCPNHFILALPTLSIRLPTSNCSLTSSFLTLSYLVFLTMLLRNFIL